MSETRDRLKSLFRQAVHTAQSGLERLPGLQQIQRAARELANFGGLVPAAQLQKDILRIDGISSVSVEVDQNGVRIEATFNDAADLSVRLVPTEVHFAPRGAKEIGFRAEPSEAARHRYATELVASVTTSIARAVWAAALGDANAPPSAIVDREGESEFRVDLRSLGVFRRARNAQAANLLLDALTLESIHPADGMLRLRVKLPIAL